MLTTNLAAAYRRDSGVDVCSCHGADNTVYEAGLNPNGSNAAANTETRSGERRVGKSGGTQNAVIDGTTYKLDQVQAFAATHGLVNTGEGILTLTGYTGDAHSVTVA